MKKLNPFLSASLLAASMTCAVAVAQPAPGAAEQPAQPPASGMTQGPARTMNPSDAQLQKFVKASQKVAMISQEYNPKVQAAPDPGQQQNIIQEAEQKMVGAVNNEGLTTEEFNGIGQAIKQDPNVRQRAQAVAPTAP